jgi:hypothetical protein
MSKNNNAAKNEIPKTTETKAVAPVKEEPKSLVNTAHEGQADWGAESVDAKDMMIPKVLLMQGLSKLVAEEKAAMGDLIDSVSFAKLGDKKTPLEIIPFYSFKTWIILQKKPGEEKYDYVETLSMDSSNEHLDPNETLEDGTEIRRDRVISFYVLLAKDFEEGAVLPYVVAFRRKSYPTGKKVVNHFKNMSMMRMPPAAKKLLLSCRLEQNDKGTFYVFDVAQGAKSSQDEIDMAKVWYDNVKTKSYKVDDSDVKPESEVETDVSSDTQTGAAAQF